MKSLLLPLVALAVLAHAADVPVKITVDAAGAGHAVSPLLHGVFFEDINYGADGGLYAELVQNRSFEHAEHLYAWGTVNRGGAGDVTIETADPLNAKNPHYARLTVRDAGKGFGLANYGFGGIAVQAGETYIARVRFRADAAFSGDVNVALEDETGREIATGCFGVPPTGEWGAMSAPLKSTGTALHARLVLTATAKGRVDLDMVSLFPEHTFHDRPNGVRADLAQMLADLHPAFMRFPGGCIVEGMDLPNRYQWKDTIGDIAERPENWNRWQDAIRGQTAPQYYQTYGLGFFEFFQLCENLGCAPVPILNCGMACQYQSKQLVPLDQLDPFVQDALDLIEFANGPADSPWGAKRAAMGHPAPFGLKMLGIGNEQWGDQYFARYPIFYRAIKAKYPDIQIVTGAGPGVDDGSWKLAWDHFRSGTPADIVDEHYYRPPQWFLENATRYDAQSRTLSSPNGPRTGTKVFAGEFAAREGRMRSTLHTAIAEAAFMTGLVRNSDLVAMSSYAPLFAKAGAFQWQPDLIWFDNTRVYGTTSYYVQQLFARNRPDVTVPIAVDGEAVHLPHLPDRDISTYGATPLPPYHPESLPAVFAAAGRNNRADETVIFLVNPYSEARDATVVFPPAPYGYEVLATVLTSANADDANSFEEPLKVAPHDDKFFVPVATSSFKRLLSPDSLTVLRIPSHFFLIP